MILVVKDFDCSALSMHLAVVAVAVLLILPLMLPPGHLAVKHIDVPLPDLLE